jgi:hypothetical protein
MLGSSHAGSRSALPWNVPFTWVVVLISAWLFPSPLRAEPVVADTRDHYTLLKQRLVNRQLFEQLGEPEQAYRLGRNWESVAFAVDGSVASTQVLSGEFSRFHGYFLFDTFTALRSPYGVDFDLNLALFNPSASDGIRVSSFAIPGGALHFYRDFELGGKHARIDVLGTDLDHVTLGNGLLLERWPLEGAFANFAYGDWYLRHYFGGRVFWPNDDLYTLQLGALGGKLEAMFSGWKFMRGPATSNYVDLSARLPLWGERFQVAAEYSLNLREQLRNALLLKTDYIDKLGDLAWHMGYRFRWYQRGFGPYRGLAAPTTTYNLPYRENEYLDNSFEYFGVSQGFEQWSHSLVAEFELPLAWGFRAFGEGEALFAFAREPAGEAYVIGSPRGHALPGPWVEGLYRTGLRLYPWPGLPHRLSAVFTNKQVETGRAMSEPTDLRFRTAGHYVSLQLEAAL